MKVNTEELSACKYNICVEVPAEEVASRMEVIYERVSKYAKIPGFRAGKIPREVLIKNYKDQIREDLINDILPNAYFKALDETKLVPITDPQFSDIKYDENTPMSFKATIEVRPSFSLPKYRGVKVDKQVATVSADEVNNVVDFLRHQRATFKAIENRPLQKDDIARIDFTGKVGDETVKGMAVKDQMLQIGSGMFPAGFEDGLIGAAAGETREIKVAFPAESRMKEIAGREVAFSVAIKEIKEKILPELNDSFVKEMGEFQGLKDFKEKIEADLLQEKTERIKSTAINKIVETLAEETIMALPESLVEHETSHTIEDLTKRMRSQGMPEEELNKQHDEMAATCRAMAEKKVKASFIIDEISHRENMPVNDGEITARIEKMKQRLGSDRKEKEEYLSSEKGRQEIEYYIRREKTLEMLFQEANITLVKGEQK